MLNDTALAVEEQGFARDSKEIAQTFSRRQYNPSLGLMVDVVEASYSLCHRYMQGSTIGNDDIEGLRRQAEPYAGPANRWHTLAATITRLAGHMERYPVARPELRTALEHALAPSPQGGKFLTAIGPKAGL